MTLLEFETIAAKEAGGYRYELDEGNLITLSPTARPHAKRLDAIYRYLIQQLPREQYDVLPGELGFVLAVEPKTTIRAADLAVLHHEEDSAPGFVQEPPLLAIEVVSPGNDPEDLEKKRIQYLDAGAQEVWIVYEKTKTIHVFQKKDGRSFVCDREGTFVSSLGFPVLGAAIFR